MATSPRAEDVDLAPPFNAASTNNLPAQDPACYECNVAKQIYREKLLRYWKKKYTVRTERHVYEAR